MPGAAAAAHAVVDGEDERVVVGEAVRRCGAGGRAQDRLVGAGELHARGAVAQPARRDEDERLHPAGERDQQPARAPVPLVEEHVADDADVDALGRGDPRPDPSGHEAGGGRGRWGLEGVHAPAFAPGQVAPPRPDGQWTLDGAFRRAGSLAGVLRTPRIPLLGAAACALGLAATGVVALLLPFGQARDSATLQGFTALNRPRITVLLDHVAHLADPRSYALIGFSLAGIALLRRRPRIAGTIVALLVLTGLTTRELKPLLASPRYDGWLGSGQIAAASWPSGHATASMTLALCAILAVPARLRPTVAVLGAGFAISVSYSILALGWHFPSDVLGGFLVAMTWTLLAVAGLAWLEERRPSALRREAQPRPGEALAAPRARRGCRGGAGRGARRPARGRRALRRRALDLHRGRRGDRGPRRAARGRAGARRQPAAQVSAAPSAA